MADDAKIEEPDALQDFPDWEIPPKQQVVRDLTEAHEEWLEDYKQQVSAGQARQRFTPVDVPF